MERLTMRNENGVAFWVDQRCCGGGYRMTEDQADQKRLDRLAAYEETRVTPEEIAEVQAAMEPILFGRFHDILEAECSGRLVVLPCRVTDTVYITEAVFENKKQKKRNMPCGERVVSAQIDHVTIGGTTGKPVFDLCTETGNWYYSMEPEQFYLTREAAEAALKEQEG